jgi:hypothetical protein
MQKLKKSEKGMDGKKTPSYPCMGMGPISLSFLVLSESTLFGSFVCNRRLAIALEVAEP